MKYKPPKQLLQRYKVDIKSDTVFASHARLTQSLWREEKGLPIGTYCPRDKEAEVELGNLLPIDFAKSERSNFLTQGIGELVKSEVNNSEGKVILEPRIWNNLLSSQPLAFNLFGELKLQKGYLNATKLFQDLLGNEVKKITNIEFEYSPGRHNPKYTNDGSAFDVFVEYTSSTDLKCFVAIEVKYSENMRAVPATHRSSYDEIANAMGIFKKQSYKLLTETGIQQLWRDHLLAGSMFVTNDDYAKGVFIILYPEGNAQCKHAVDKYKGTFVTLDVEATHFIPITIETLVAKLTAISQEQWVADFQSRYLDFDKVKALLAK